jgi:hypothetical protein
MRGILAGGALLASVVSAAESPQAAFTLGVLRRDALVVPFATYDGKRWENHWPEPSQGVDVPINLGSVPRRWWGQGGPLDAWQIWTEAALPRLVHVRQPDWLQTHCQKQVGLRTDYQPSECGSPTVPERRSGRLAATHGGANRDSAVRLGRARCDGRHPAGGVCRS